MSTAVFTLQYGSFTLDKHTGLLETKMDCFWNAVAEASHLLHNIKGITYSLPFGVWSVVLL